MSKVLFRGLLFLLLPGFSASCAADEAPAGEEGAAVEDVSPGSTFERLAGTWAIRAFNEAGDSIPGHTLVATADSSGWMINFPDRPTVPVHILDASGDLVVYETEAYESVIRPGVQVTVVFVTRVDGGGLTGRFIANYDVAGASAVLRGRTEGTRQ